jgi:uncharacterized membrane protein YhiD involved in acid resistance
MNVFPNYYAIPSISQEISFLGSGEIFANLTVALVCGMLITLFYRWTNMRSDYSPTFTSSLVALSMITTIVITVIGNNLARAFGLVGALAIVRFRMAVKDMQDIIFVFFALAMGMAAGVGMLLTTVGGTIFIGVIILLLSQLHGASPRRREFALQFSSTWSGESGENNPPYRQTLEKHCKRHELIRVKSSNNGDTLVLSFSIALKSDTSEELARELEQIAGVSRVFLTKNGLNPRQRRKPRKKSKPG